ncbi:iron-sulfur cluster assembly scaffold protein [Thermodesulfobacteriota bacterium]
MKDRSMAHREPEKEDPRRYNGKVLDHFRNPRNVGKVERYDGIGTNGDPSCGDYLEVTIKVDEFWKRIIEARFLAYGCAGAIATSSMMTELAIGKTFEEALQISDEDVINALGGLPTDKEHCSLLGVLALHRAVLDCLTMRDMIRKGRVSGRAEYREMRAHGLIRSESHNCDGTCGESIQVEGCKE